MKISKQRIREIIREELLNEQPPIPQKKKPPQPPAGGGGEGETTKDLKIDIPDSPFNPDVKQVVSQLGNILKQWEIKEYPTDKVRWKSYYKDILQLINKIKGDVS